MGEQLQAPTIGEIVEACRSVLPPEDLDDLAQMERDEAMEYLLSYLPEFGIDDPEQFMVDAGLAERLRELTPEEFAARNSLTLTGEEYSVDEEDEKDRNLAPKPE